MYTVQDKRIEDGAALALSYMVRGQGIDPDWCATFDHKFQSLECAAQPQIFLCINEQVHRQTSHAEEEIIHVTTVQQSRKVKQRTGQSQFHRNSQASTCVELIRDVKDPTYVPDDKEGLVGQGRTHPTQKLNIGVCIPGNGGTSTLMEISEALVR